MNAAVVAAMAVAVAPAAAHDVADLQDAEAALTNLAAEEDPAVATAAVMAAAVVAVAAAVAPDWAAAPLVPAPA